MKQELRIFLYKNLSEQIINFNIFEWTSIKLHGHFLTTTKHLPYIYIYIYGKGEIAQRACSKMNDTTCLTREFADQADHQPRLTSKWWIFMKDQRKNRFQEAIAKECPITKTKHRRYTKRSSLCFATKEETNFVALMRLEIRTYVAKKICIAYIGRVRWKECCWTAGRMWDEAG